MTGQMGHLRRPTSGGPEESRRGVGGRGGGGGWDLGLGVGERGLGSGRSVS